MFAHVRISNSMYKSSFSVQICTQSVTNVLKHTLKKHSWYMQSSFVPSACSTEAGHLGTTYSGTCCVDRRSSRRSSTSTLAWWKWTLLVQMQCGLAVAERITDSEPEPHSHFGGRQYLVEIVSCDPTSLGVWCLITWSLQGGQKLSNEDVKALLHSEILSAVPPMS